ncbi:DUF1887 domain-containing protein [Cyanobacteria bacterium FACHB-63]|nr:DUF1887 domain-containing protein [Cyanobacteria bacterium FACHB-63]
MNKFEQYQVQYLLLLIGENPLPNYVAIRTLLKPGGTSYLFYTSHTKGQAERLRDCIENLGYIAKLKSIDGHESDSYYIQKDVREIVTQLPQDSIGLHYTGGTKAMAVHVYRTLIKERPNAIFSYLDSRRLEMCIDREDGTRFHEKVSLSLTLTEIFDLHQLSLIEPALTTPKQPEAAIALAHLHSSPDIAKVWREWCNRVKSSTNEEETLDLKLLPTEIEAFLQEHCPAIFATELQKKEIRSLLDETWLDGKWLEQYTLQQIQTLPESLSIVDSATSFRVEDPKKPSSRDEFFELDVAFTRGYQLFALSCTTDDRTPPCKYKLFEAYLRAKQLGGDEARVALVCCSDKPELLKTRLEIMLENPQIAVFGRRHLVNLADQIAAWIIRSDREAQSNE